MTCVSLVTFHDKKWVFVLMASVESDKKVVISGDFFDCGEVTFVERFYFLSIFLNFHFHLTNLNTKYLTK